MSAILGTITTFLAKPKVILYTLLGVAVVGVYFYIQYLQGEIDTYVTNQARLEIALSENQLALDNLRLEHNIIVETNKDLNNFIEELDHQKTELEETLYREREKKKSLEQLAIEAASKIEYRVNKATSEVLRCLEIASGDKPKNEDEREKFKDCNIE